MRLEELCQPKEAGGVQIRDLRKVNLALLAKLCWFIWQEEDSLWVEVIKKKYLKTDNLLSLSASS